jgi:hypothetical protein
MPWHKPRFRLVHLIVLVAVLAVEFALLPRSFSAGVAALTVVTSILAAVSGPFTRMEWASIVAIHALLILLFAPAVQSSHGRPRKPKPATTIAPVSGKI